MEQPHKTNHTTRRGHKSPPGTLLIDTDQCEFYNRALLVQSNIGTIYLAQNIKL